MNIIKRLIRFNTKKWAVIRQKGKKHFIIKYGVLFFGILSALFATICLISLDIWIWNDYSSNDNVFKNKIVNHFMFFIVIMPIVGYFWGLWMWEISEKKYKKAIRKPLILPKTNTKNQYKCS